MLLPGGKRAAGTPLASKAASKHTPSLHGNHGSWQFDAAKPPSPSEVTSLVLGGWLFWTDAASCAALRCVVRCCISDRQFIIRPKDRAENTVSIGEARQGEATTGEQDRQGRETDRPTTTRDKTDSSL
ncbi:hypothetical protein CGRA01v4_00687 [Colletotrichum graminicola]|nr:hypothetical protein CGRA01v4_00687 [Colletotrichum graminicola]